MHLLRFSPALLAVAFAAAPLPLRGQDTAVVRLYGEAVSAGKAGRIPEAIRLMESVAARAPEATNAHWNLGLWYAGTDRPADALRAWEAYRRLVPGDWHARAKVIQAHQALGDTVRRDRERAALLELRRAGTDTALARQKAYVREQFRAGGQRVMVFEVFEPAGEMRVFYAFYVLAPDGEEIRRYSLGSYDRTTQVAREMGEIGRDERLYHLDWYQEDAHATVQFFKSMPTYDEVRARVVAAMAGQPRPAGSPDRP